MRMIFGCEEAALFDQSVIEAREGITQLEAALSYLCMHCEPAGRDESRGSQETGQKFKQAVLWCRQADEMIGKVGALFKEEMAGLRARQQATLLAWQAERQAACISSGKPTPACKSGTPPDGASLSTLLKRMSF
jgi:hypothetical protein